MNKTIVSFWLQAEVQKSYFDWLLVAFHAHQLWVVGFFARRCAFRCIQNDIAFSCTQLHAKNTIVQRRALCVRAHTLSHTESWRKTITKRNAMQCSMYALYKQRLNETKVTNSKWILIWMPSTDWCIKRNTKGKTARARARAKKKMREKR